MLIAFDEFAWAPLLDPPLTVVDEDSRSIGELAARKLTAIIKRSAAQGSGSIGPVYTAGDVQEVKASLLIRKSCGC